MGRAKIKLKTKEQAANYYLARPHTFSYWRLWWLRILGFFKLATKYSSMERDSQGRPTIELHGYAYRGAIYVTDQVTWEYKGGAKWHK